MKTSSILILLALLLIPAPILAQELWSKSPISPKGAVLMNVAPDGQGGLYIYGGRNAPGTSADTLIFFTDSLFLNNNENFLAHFNSEGNLVWAKKIWVDGGIPPLTNNLPAGIFGKLTSHQGDIFLSARFGGNSLWVENDSLEIDSPTASGFIKFNGQGKPQWSIQPRGNVDDAVHAIATDGSIYLSGVYNGTVQWGSFHFANPRGFYVVKLSPAGQVQWLRSFKVSSFLSRVRAIGTDQNNNVYIGGSMRDTVSIGGNDFISDAQGEDPFVATLTSTGQFEWLTSAPATGNSDVHVLEFHNGAGYLGGMATDVQFGSDALAGRGSFLAKFDLSGNFEWAKRYSPNEDLSLLIFNNDGIFAGVNDRGFGIHHLDFDGNEKWNYLNQSNGNAYMLGMTLDSADNITIAGKYSGPLNMGSDFHSAKPTDYFIAKIVNCNDFVLTLDPANDFAIKDTQSAQVGVAFPEKYEANFYMWYQDNNLSTQDSAAFHLMPPYGSMTSTALYAIVWSQEGCIDTSETIRVTIEKPIGVSATAPNSNFILYPNPVAGDIFIECKNGLKKYERVTVSLTDVTGKILQEQRFSTLENTMINIPVDGLPPGMYFIHVQTEDEIAGIYKVIKQ
ncbi:MAG: T9SS type A sorting domain-containing protein [Bacteroidia bacterium]